MVPIFQMTSRLPCAILGANVVIRENPIPKLQRHIGSVLD
jgi:hypothetical protein